MTHMMRPRLLMAVALVASALGAPYASAETASGDRFDFEVFLDGKPIGAHRFELVTRGEQQVVVSEADFEVKALLFTVYSYRHRNREVWRGGCLHSIDARTDSNGDFYQVRGEPRDGGFLVRTAQTSARLEPCVRTFAYWDRRLLEKARLLNSQTGEHIAVTLRKLGAGTVTLGAQKVPVKRYALVGENIDIVLSYAEVTDEWVALDSRLDNGRTLQYRRRSAASGVPSDQPQPDPSRGGEA